MTPGSSAVIRARKIAELRERVARVRELLPSDLPKFLADRTAAEALIFNLYLALQASSDLALRLVAEHGLGVPGNAREAFAILGRAGMLWPELAQRLAASVGLRNRIAHQYGTLDLGLVFAAALDELPDLDAFAASAAACNGPG